MHPQYATSAKLVLIGGARNDEDEARVSALNEEAAKLGLQVWPCIFYFNGHLTSTSAPGKRCVCGECSVPSHAGVASKMQHRCEYDGRRAFWDQRSGVYGA